MSLQSSPASPQSPPGPLRRLLRPMRIEPEAHREVALGYSPKRALPVRNTPSCGPAGEQAPLPHSHHDSGDSMSGDEGGQGGQEAPRDVSEEFDIVFFLGDLNYRCAVPKNTRRN
jgi:hypothetical protein